MTLELEESVEEIRHHAYNHNTHLGVCDIMVKIGDKAPDFELPSTKGGDYRLKDKIKGKGLLLAFYPFDWSPVCTNELGFLNANSDEFKKAKVGLAAISVDSVFSHEAWTKHEKFSFPLLSDFNKEVSKEYGALHEELGGMKGFCKRSLFLLDSTGNIQYTWISEDPGQEPDYDELLEAVKKL